MDNINGLFDEEIGGNARMNYMHGLEDGLLIAQENILGMSFVRKLEADDRDQLKMMMEYLLQGVQKRRATVLCAYVEDAHSEVG